VSADLPYTVRRSSRARRVRVSVDPRAGVEVVLPARAPARAAAAAVAELRPWIERRLLEADVVRAHLEARGDTVPYLGVRLRLVPQAGRSRVHRRGDELLVPAGPPTNAKLMKAVLHDEPFTDPDWVFERKLDGIFCKFESVRAFGPWAAECGVPTNSLACKSLSHHQLCNRPQLHVRRTFIDLADLGIAIQLLDRIVLRVPVPAEELHGQRRDALGHLR